MGSVGRECRLEEQVRVWYKLRSWPTMHHNTWTYQAAVVSNRGIGADETGEALVPTLGDRPAGSREHGKPGVFNLGRAELKKSLLVLGQVERIEPVGERGWRKIEFGHWSDGCVPRVEQRGKGSGLAQARAGVCSLPSIARESNAVEARGARLARKSSGQELRWWNGAGTDGG